MAEMGEHTELSLTPNLEPDHALSARIREALAPSLALIRAYRTAHLHGIPDPIMVAVQHGTVPAERARLLHEAEERANEFLARDDGVLEAIVYKTLYARGLRIGTIDASIRSALDRKLGLA